MTMDPTAVLSEWNTEKERWVAPSVEPYAISTCTIGVQLKPAVSFPKMADWLVRNRSWEEVKDGNQLKVNFGNDKLTTILLWNPFLFQEKEAKKNQKKSVKKNESALSWEQSPSGHLAHKALPNYYYNSVSFLVYLGEGRKTINVKYFVNGNMTLTGCTHLVDAEDAIKILRSEFEKNVDYWFDVKPESFEIATPFVYRMMNAYFSFGFPMDCLKVYNICMNELGLYVSYDPKDYQGVIIYYLWNKNQDIHDGHCVCENTCPLTAKRRTGNGEHDCIKLTFIVFSTGKVLITGAISEEMMRDCYNFFVEKFANYSKQLVQFSFQDFLKKKQIESGEKPKRRQSKRVSKKNQQPMSEVQNVVNQSVSQNRSEVSLTHYWPQESQ